MREIENFAKEMPDAFRLTLKEAKNTIKVPCTHTGGIIDVDKCIETYIGKRNEEKVFLASNDEDLRIIMRNKGIVPIIFQEKKTGMLILDKPSELIETKH